jgi:hypothetical protein
MTAVHPDDKDWNSREDAAYDRPVEHAPVSGASRIAEEILPKIPFFGRIKDLAYSVAATQIAVGIMSAIYIVIWQGTYFGRSNKPYWDGLNQEWHFRAVPWIGNFLYGNWDIGRHLFFRDALESVLAYALVVMVIVKIKRLKDKTPLVHRVLGFCHMPTPYQGRMTGWRGKPRKAQTTPLQYVFLLPSMFLAAVPGMALAAAVIYGGMAYAHHRGYYSPWLTPESPWVPIAVGIAGGNAFGHLPAVKAGQDVQKYFLRLRLAIAYFAEDMLENYRDGTITLARARDEITALRGTKPGRLYPDVYRARYDTLLSRREPADRGSRLEKASIMLFVFVLTVLAVYGLYARKWAIPHDDLWIP